VKVYLHSLGCRLNQGEIQKMARQFAAAGCVLVEEPGAADVCIVNTCVVTVQAERKSRHLLRTLHRANPDARIAAIGCYPTLAPEKVAAAPEVAWAVPNAEKDQTVVLVLGEASPVLALPLRPADETGGAAPVPYRTRAFVKVQEGCENHCTYCIVRHLRGPSTSRPPDEVLGEVRAHVAAGYQEVVLTGVNLGAYGRDLGIARGLESLVSVLLDQTALPRLRLSSLEPWDLDEGFFSLWQDRRLCRQLHLPIQSGCDETLRRMGRRNTADEFARLAEAALAAIPGLALTTDLMVGFPGEDEAAFAESLAFVRRVHFARLHVFRFSPRPGTPAIRLPGRVPHHLSRERARRMRELGEGLARVFRERFVGQEMDVLWEHRRPDGRYHGLTDNYLSVVASSTDDLHNRITCTRLVDVEGAVLRGEATA
jgi:threonylcarbamoyladenosine tRNA methylthiotransferase MtaB